MFRIKPEPIQASQKSEQNIFKFRIRNPDLNPLSSPALIIIDSGGGGLGQGHFRGGEGGESLSLILEEGRGISGEGHSLS